MTHHDSGWRPKGALDTYRGFEVSDHTVGANEFNPGVVDGEVDLTGHTTGDHDEE